MRCSSLQSVWPGETDIPWHFDVSLHVAGCQFHFHLIREREKHSMQIDTIPVSIDTEVELLPFFRSYCHSARDRRKKQEENAAVSFEIEV